MKIELMNVGNGFRGRLTFSSSFCAPLSHSPSAANGRLIEGTNVAAARDRPVRALPADATALRSLLVPSSKTRSTLLKQGSAPYTPYCRLMDDDSRRRAQSMPFPAASTPESDLSGLSQSANSGMQLGSVQEEGSPQASPSRSGIMSPGTAAIARCYVC